ncbi:EamA/RhaT family transporter (plasmid) [Azospirillum humicireducens]|uniref:EamA/RhaT family transporter n=1 Tax=Azospirillum humicireducens TaxID=1226968 RepID=A0A2R4VVM1_9PROT|nr:DMT family transporter [Azospirillum humicireducens]AWB08479.1 EamA/RhaT family transporter [Azospirillum humicireducens]
MERSQTGARTEAACTPAFLPLILLCLCGFLFASKIMVSKAALSAGADPFQLGIVGNLGAGLLLCGWLAARGESMSSACRSPILYLVLGIVSVALPTILSFHVVERVGPAYTATVYSLSPILTMSFAAGFGIERMTVRRSAGIVTGLLGMMALVQQQLAAIDFAQPIWVMIGLLIPACTAAGNIIRSAFWPTGASALAFACATLFTSSLVMATLSPLFGSGGRWRFADPILGLWFAGFVLVSALSYILNFRLQKVAGAVVFSQIGYWGTGFGVLLAALLFGDMLTAPSLIGLAAIVIGGVLANWSRGRAV